MTVKPGCKYLSADYGAGLQVFQRAYSVNNRTVSVPPATSRIVSSAQKKIILKKRAETYIWKKMEFFMLNK